MHKISLFIEEIDEFYRSDVLKICQACLNNGYVISPIEAFAAWQKYSNSMAVGWMTINNLNYEEICDIVKYQLEVK